MKVIILAAGMGKRLLSLTKENTKCMVKVGGVSLIERLMIQLKQYDIAEIIAVVGYKGNKLIKYIGEIIKRNNIDIPVNFIENADYATTNNIYSLFLARKHFFDDDVILFESDLIFDNEIIEQVFNSYHENFALVAKYSEWMDGTVITLDEECNITNFISKSSFDFNSKDKYYKTANVYKFSKNFSKDYYIPFLEAYIKSKGLNEFYEQVLSTIVFMNNNLCKAEIIKKGNWYEIDDVNDLNIAETLFAPEDKRIELYTKRYGGYWRFNNLIDFYYLVNPFFPPNRMIDEIKNMTETLIINYPSGINVQRSLAANMFQVHQEYITVGNGASELIRNVLKFSKLNTGILFPTFEEYANSIDSENVFYININHDFSYNAEIIISSIEQNNLERIVIIAPDNPSGYLISYMDLLKFLDYTLKHSIQVIFDESFMDFADENVKYSLINNEILYKYNNLIVIKSISKSYGIPGLRIGIIASSNQDIINYVVKSCPIWNINSFAEFFMQIMNKYKVDFQIACQKLINTREEMLEQLQNIKHIKAYPSQANYILCKIEKQNFNVNELVNICLDYGILLKDCSNKQGFDGSIYIRIAVKKPNENNLLINLLKQLIEEK